MTEQTVETRERPSLAIPFELEAEWIEDNRVISKNNPLFLELECVQDDHMGSVGSKIYGLLGQYSDDVFGFHSAPDYFLVELGFFNGNVRMAKFSDMKGEDEYALGEGKVLEVWSPSNETSLNYFLDKENMDDYAKHETASYAKWLVRPLSFAEVVAVAAERDAEITGLA